MWKRNRVAVLLFTVLCVFSAEAQQDGLRELVEKALENNYGIRFARNEQKMAERSNTYGNAGFLPRVYLNADQQFNVRNSEQEFVTGEAQEVDGGRSQNTSAVVGLEWTVFDGFRMFAEKDRLEKLTVRGKAGTRYYIEQTLQDLAAAYYGYVQGRHLLEEFRMVLHVSRERLELEKNRNRVGAGSELDVKRAEINLNADSMRVIEHLNRLRNFEYEINRLAGIDTDNRIGVAEGFDLDPAIELSEIESRSKERNTELNIAQLDMLIEEQNVKVQRSNLMPELTLFGEYSYNRSTSDFGFLFRNRQLGPAVGVRLRFNLYDGGRERIALENAETREKNAVVTIEEKEKEIETAVRTAGENYSAAQQKLLLAESNVKQAESLQKIADEQFRLGSITSLEYRQVQLEVLQAKTTLIEAKFQMKENEIMLYRLAGMLPEKILD